MQRRVHWQVPLALAAGCGLLWLAVQVIGLLAAIPTPLWIQELVGTKGAFAQVVHFDALVHLPMAVIAAAFALPVFLLLRRSSWQVALALAAPWLGYCIWEGVTYYREAQLSPSHKLALLLAWHTWFGRASVPLGVWVAKALAARSVHGAA